MSLVLTIIRVAPNGVFAVRREQDDKMCMVAFRRSTDATKAVSYLRRHVRHNGSLPSTCDTETESIKLTYKRGDYAASSKNHNDKLWTVFTLQNDLDELLEWSKIHFFDVYVTEKVSFSSSGDVHWMDVFAGGRKLSVPDPVLHEFLAVERG
jgi:hypothetical protein